MTRATNVNKSTASYSRFEYHKAISLLNDDDADDDEQIYFSLLIKHLLMDRFIRVFFISSVFALQRIFGASIFSFVARKQIGLIQFLWRKFGT